MTNKRIGAGQKILIVDDEHMSDLMRSVLRRLEADGFNPIVVSPEGPHITATLFYASTDGLPLVPVDQEVPLAEGLVQQGFAPRRSRGLGQIR